jgi:serine/threonine protein kinase
MVDRGMDNQFIDDGINISDYGMPNFYQTMLRNGQYHNVMGSHGYIAPEIRELGLPPTIQSDIWSIGCIGYELCLGQRLSENRALLTAHRENGDNNANTLDALVGSIDPRRFGYPVRLVLYKCLQWHPHARCTATQLRDYILENRPR